MIGAVKEIYSLNSFQIAIVFSVTSFSSLWCFDVLIILHFLKKAQSIPSKILQNQRKKMTKKAEHGVWLLIFLRKEQMQMKLVLAEKPSVAQSIAKVLGAAKREDVGKTLPTSKEKNSLANTLRRQTRWVPSKKTQSVMCPILMERRSSS